jgi:hypothetical protein
MVMIAYSSRVGGRVRAAAWVVAVATLGGSAACDRDSERVEYHEKAMSERVMVAATKLEQRRIFFAHQSVGGNIMDGVAALQHEPGAPRLRVVEVKGEMPVTTSPFLAHARLGQNGDPRSKTEAFIAALEGGLGGSVDVAMQKYCFVDIEAKTDVNQLFGYYRDAMARLHREFPNLTIVHVTTPLVRVQSGPKAAIKRLLGRAPDHYEDNIARNRYNDLMRREYGSREPVFDLAAIEASRPGGSPEPFQFNGSDVFELRAEYTTDGGHLNADAQRRVAAEFLTFLARVVDQTPTGTR